LLGIAYHKTVDLMRSRQRHEADELDPALPDEEATDMALVLQRMEDIGRVQEALAQLKPMQRCVLHLAFYEDLPYAEIAGVLECPEGTVKTRVFHAKQALKRLLDRV
jgi:RNA polymerase sigma-70 factor (ECF subfamily)